LTRIIEDLRGEKPIAIIGLGNKLRRDDGVGVYVASKLKNLLRDVSGVEVIVAEDRVDYAAKELEKVNPRLIIVMDATAIAMLKSLEDISGKIYGLDIDTRSSTSSSTGSGNSDHLDALDAVDASPGVRLE